MRPGRAIGAAVALAGVLAAGCATAGDDVGVVAVGVPSSTTGRLDVDEATPSSLPPVSPIEMKQRLDTSLSQQNFCAFFDTIDSAVPDLDDREAVMEAYDVLAGAAGRAGSIVPSELSAPWAVVRDSIEAGAKAARAANGDIGDPGVRMVFESQDLGNAQRQIERWLGDHCTATD